MAIDAKSRDLVLNLLKQEPAERLGVDSFEDLKRHAFFDAAVEAQRIVWGNMSTVLPPSRRPPRLLRRLEEPEFDGANDDWDLRQDFKDLRFSEEATRIL